MTAAAEFGCNILLSEDFQDGFRINPGFVFTGLAGIANRLVVADLSPVHQFRASLGSRGGGFDGNGFAGSHSDISFREVYQIICGFF